MGLGESAAGRVPKLQDALWEGVRGIGAESAWHYRPEDLGWGGGLVGEEFLEGGTGRAWIRRGCCLVRVRKGE